MKILTMLFKVLTVLFSFAGAVFWFALDMLDDDSDIDVPSDSNQNYDLLPDYSSSDPKQITNLYNTFWHPETYDD